MILPGKHLPEAHSLLGVGAVLLGHMDGHDHTVSSLWEIVRRDRSIGTFGRFVLALDLLYVLNAVTLEDGVLTVRTP